MNQRTGMIVALVLLGAAAIWITRLQLENFQLQVELQSHRNQKAAVAKLPPVQVAPSAAPVAAAATPNREVSESARQMMVDALVAEQGSDKVLWLRVEPRDREASGFANQIATIFRDNGWEVKVLDTDGMRFKPGMLFLVAGEEEPPSYVVNAQKAIEAIGEQVTTGRGYLSYYEAKKKEDPKWVGTKFAPEQSHVLLIGRKPDPAATAQ